MWQAVARKLGSPVEPDPLKEGGQTLMCLRDTCLSQMLTLLRCISGRGHEMTGE